MTEEVLQRQSEAVREFLLKTSILKRLCGPACDAVLETSHSQDTLEYLERANLFIVPLDDRREWYRYHRLFSDLLQSHLRQQWPDAAPALHRRASEWHEQHGDLEAAIEYALEATEPERAADLLEQVAEATLMSVYASVGGDHLNFAYVAGAALMLVGFVASLAWGAKEAATRDHEIT